MATTTTLSVNPNPAVAGHPVRLVAHVAPQGAAHGAAGTIQFLLDGANLGDAQSVNAGGVATLRITTLSAGTHTLTAVFTPTDPAFGPSTSQVTLTVQPLP